MIMGHEPWGLHKIRDRRVNNLPLTIDDGAAPFLFESQARDLHSHRQREKTVGGRRMRASLKVTQHDVATFPTGLQLDPTREPLTDPAEALRLRAVLDGERDGGV